MKEQDIERIIKIFNKNFRNKDILIIFEGSIETYIKMNNFKFLLTRDDMVLTDGKDKKLKIDLYWANNVKIQENRIEIDMESDYMICIEVA